MIQKANDNNRPATKTANRMTLLQRIQVTQENLRTTVNSLIDVATAHQNVLQDHDYRIAALEDEIEQLKEQRKPWWKRIIK